MQVDPGQLALCLCNHSLVYVSLVVSIAPFCPRYRTSSRVFVWIPISDFQGEYTSILNYGYLDAQWGEHAERVSPWQLNRLTPKMLLPCY